MYNTPLIKGLNNMGKLSVVSNNFILARHKLTALQLDFMYLLANKIRTDDKIDFIEFDKEQLFNDLNINKNNLFYVEQTLDKLLSIIVNYKEDTTRVKAVLLTTFKWDDGIVKVRINEDVKKQFYELVNNFTKLDYIALRELKSVYSKKLFAICQKQINLFNNIKKQEFLNFRIDLAEIRNIFLGDKSKKYPSLKDFRVYTLDVAVKEINNNCDFIIEYKYLKNGRKVVAFSFQIEIKKEVNTDFKRLNTDEIKQKEDENYKIWYQINSDFLAPNLTQYDKIFHQQIKNNCYALVNNSFVAFLSKKGDTYEPNFAYYCEYFDNNNYDKVFSSFNTKD